MSVFRIRDPKKRPPRKNTFSSNLSTIHQQQVKDFSKRRESLMGASAKLEDINKRIKELESEECKTLDQLKELSSLHDETVALTSHIRQLETCSDMMDYYYATSDIITQYDELENNPSKGKVTITDFFRDYSTDNTDEKRHSRTACNKRELLEKYLEATRPDYFKDIQDDDFAYCDTCDKEMVIKKEHGTFVCTHCGRTNEVLVDGEAGKVTIPDGLKYSIYQRKNHFREWLNQIQAKETTEIPEDVFDLILVELNKIHFQNLADLNPTIIRNILKKLNLSKYYENVFHIIYRLNGLQPPTLSRDIEEKLLQYFKQIEEPFRLFKKKGRKNILRYSYILYKLCELLELDDFLRCFRLLKNRNKLMEQDIVWAQICGWLHWEFIPSM